MPAEHPTAPDPEPDAARVPAWPAGRANPDPRAMRALAHPIRLRILDLLGERGPMTATEVAEEIGESAANCSFHLRTLAKYGFAEEAGGGKGRNRPWKASFGELFLDPRLLTGSARRAATVLQDAIEEKDIERLRRWRTESAQWPDAWQAAGFSMAHEGVRLTADELAEVSRAIWNLIEAYQRRPAADIPADARRIRLTAAGFPVGEPPDASAQPRPDPPDGQP